MTPEITSPEITSIDAYRSTHARSLSDPDGFWSEVARTYHWFQPWNHVRSGDFHDLKIRWFEGGTTNLSYNCLDRHLAARGNQPAIVWESNDPNEDTRTLTYAELHREVMRFALLLERYGVQTGDRVCLYMPMVPEAAIAMLACARIGAIHSIVFGGFSAQSLSDRINDATCKVVLTADSTMRGTKEVRLKDIVDEALLTCPTIETVLVLRRTGNHVEMKPGRDHWWGRELERIPADAKHEAKQLPSETPLFILYTSGSTGKPKGILHTTGGYMTYVGYTFRNVFQIKPGDRYWCTADVGWITGHSYLVYGPLLNGVTTLMFEGVPNYPDFGRFWDVVDKHQVNILYTAPTAIRALEAAGLEHLAGKKLDSLRVLGTVGEPINEEAWHWYHGNVGKTNCPIVDTWWQTETGGIMISTLAGITPSIPTFATLPMPGIEPILLDDKGQPVKPNPDGSAEGNLCIARPWPSMARTTWGDDERFRNTYFSTYKGYYFTGDGARHDADGNFRITGRVDDVINVSGHRIGTAEVEDAINEHAGIVESAVVGYPHELKGQGIYAYVILDADHHVHNHATFTTEVRDLVAKLIGPFAKPDLVQIVPGLPKTRSGKIMRRILRKIAEGDTSNLGDTSTLLDPAVVDAIKAGALVAAK